MQRFTKLECQACPHRKNVLMSCCSLEDLDFVDNTKTTQYYKKGQFIYQEGSQAIGLFCIQQGKVKLSKAAGDNKEQIVHLLREGEMVGYRASVTGTRYTHSAVALEDCVVCCVPRPHFLHLVQANQQFAAALMQLLALALGQAEQRMLHLAYKPVRERLAVALLQVQQIFQQEGDALPFRVALGREDLAAIVGTAKETVSRLLSEFKEAGLIATRGSQITILKPTRLQELATMYD
jgi:CRP-like cAMP-binding protein